MSSDSSENKIQQMSSRLIIVALSVYFIYVANGILIPLLIGFLFAVLLYPLTKFFHTKLKFPNFFASLFSVCIAIAAVLGIFTLMSSQLYTVFSDIPEVTKNLKIHLHSLQSWVETMFKVDYKEQFILLEKTVANLELLNSSSFQQLLPLTTLMVNIVLVPLYSFFILLYRKIFIQFFHQLFPASKQVNVILTNINEVIRQYIVGLLIEMSIIAFLIGLGLYIIGVKYFLFLALLTAILNLIPYIGAWIAGIVSVLLALVGSSDLVIVLEVLIVFVSVQALDANVLLPLVVGSKVRINALASMLGIIILGTLAGIGGMFLAMPILAILKVVFDHIDGLKAYGTLIGDGSEEEDDIGKSTFIQKWKTRISKMFKKVKE
jgi:predicted PurR-regulated permease PerM